MALKTSWNTPVQPFSNSNGAGWYGQDVATMLNDTGAAITEGEIYALDTTSLVDGSFRKIRALGASDSEYAITCVALESGANSTTAFVRVAFRAADVEVKNSSANTINAGAPASIEASDDGLEAVDQDHKVVAYALEAVAAGANGSFCFNGVEGFGTKSSA